MSILFLSSPDLLASPLTTLLAKKMQYSIGPSRTPISNLDASDAGFKLRELQQRLLKEQQKEWYQLVDTPSELLQRKDVAAQLNDVVSRVGGSSSLIVSDPLLCFFLPLWQSLDDVPVVVFYYSEPLECAINLQKKWRFPLAFGLALWESYALAACKNIIATRHAIVSPSKLRRSGKTHLRAVSKKLVSLGEAEFSQSILEGIDMLSDLPKLRAYTDEQLECLQPSQLEIFEFLEEGSLKAIAKRDISYPSVDILERYGQLRAGFEATKKALEEAKAKLLLAEQKRPVPNASDTGEITQKDHGQLTQVTVHLKDIPPLIFHCEAGAPVLDMLRDHLVNSARNEMIYLNCTETQADEAVYFMSADMVSIGIDNIEAH
jgi:hypothetical protein